MYAFNKMTCKSQAKPFMCTNNFYYFDRWANITLSQSVLENLFPGQVTAVFTRKEDLNASLNPHTSLIGIRIPNNDFIRQLVRRCQFPIALTSANRSGTKSALQIDVSHLTPPYSISFNAPK